MDCTVYRVTRVGHNWMTFTSLHMLKIQFYFLSCDMTIFFTLFFNLVCCSLSYRLRGTVYFEYLWYELQIYFSQVAVFFFFLAALGLRCSEGAFSNCTLHRASLVVWQWVSLWDLRSLTRDQILSPCTGRQILNHWTTREVPSGCCLLILLFVIFFWRLFCLTF